MQPPAHGTPRVCDTSAAMTSGLRNAIISCLRERLSASGPVASADEAEGGCACAPTAVVRGMEELSLGQPRR